MKCNQSGNSIRADSSNGPIFGGGIDLFISDNSNINFKSYSNLGKNYKHPIYSYESYEAKTFLAGTEYFSILDIEVYVKDRNYKF